MTDQETMTDVPVEGESTIIENAEAENSEASSTETSENDDTQSSDGDNSQNDDTGAAANDDPDKDKPFHEHPRWKQREEEWTTRFNEQETRHQTDLQGLREEFGGTKKADDESTSSKIPTWFGGDQDQWDAYCVDRDRELKETEERAFQRGTQAQQTESKKVQEATEFLKTEVAAIEADKDINPTGGKIDPNKLLKFTLDNDLVDSQGRWNYRAGFKLMSKEAPAPKPKPADANAPRKAVAGATNSETRAETKPANFKTSADFKKSRPW